MAAAAGAGAGARLWAAAVLLLAGAGPAPAELTDGNSEHLKREHSLMKPYQGERGPGGGPGTGGANTGGGTGPGAEAAPCARCRRGLGRHAAVGLPGQHHGHQPVRAPHARRAQPGGLHLEPSGEHRDGGRGGLPVSAVLTPSCRLSAQPCFLKDWELHVHFKIHGAGKKNLHGDGLALWYTQERLVPGGCPVSGCPAADLGPCNGRGAAPVLEGLQSKGLSSPWLRFISLLLSACSHAPANQCFCSSSQRASHPCLCDGSWEEQLSACNNAGVVSAGLCSCCLVKLC